MRVPSRFFAATFLGTIIGFALFWSLVRLQLGVPTESSRWCYDIVQRKQQLARAVKGKKLVLVGGSSVLFGLRADEIEKHVAIPTINYGLHAALTVPYILDLAKQVLNPGDTVLLALEYSGYDAVTHDQVFIDYMMSRDPARFEQAPLMTKLKWGFGFSAGDLIERYTARRKALSNNKGSFPYDVSFLNQNGDQTGHLAAKRPADRHKVFDDERLLGFHVLDTSAAAQNIRVFCDWANKNNVRVLATFPNVVYRAEFATSENEETILDIENFYRAINVPLLGTAREAMLPDTDFFDTRYHLTEESARERTKRLLVHLRPFLNQ